LARRDGAVARTPCGGRAEAPDAGGGEEDLEVEDESDLGIELTFSLREMLNGHGSAHGAALFAVGGIVFAIPWPNA
jgi:hypothetical protein